MAMNKFWNQLHKLLLVMCLLPWNSAEISYFMFRHMLGLKFQGDRLYIKPALYQTTSPLNADIRYKQGRIKLEITGSGKLLYANVNGKKIKPDSKGKIFMPSGFNGGFVRIVKGN